MDAQVLGMDRPGHPRREGPANRATAGRLEAYRAKRGIKVSVDKLQEEIWLVACGAVLSALSGCLLAYGPTFARCNLFDTSECYSGFSSSDVPQEIALYYLTEVGWYLSLILKSVVGVGRFDSFVMEFHHVVTLALVIWSYATGFTRVGVLTFFVFNQSNPLLHFSKLVNYTLGAHEPQPDRLPRLHRRLLRLQDRPAAGRGDKVDLVGPPGAVTPEEWSGAVVYTWYTTNALLLALWALNVWWLGPIVRVIARSAARRR